MYEEQANHYKPPFQQAYRELCNGTSEGVFRHKDLQLANTADPGPWEPCEDVLDCVPNIKSIEIEMISKATNIDEVLDIFHSERNIGLVLMGRDISRDDRPSLIVLTTKNVYYVIDPNDIEAGMGLLKTVLQTPDLTLWTTNGLFEADCLYKNYGIKLLGSRAKCCQGLHLHLMKVISCMPQRVLDAYEEGVSMYPGRSLRLARRKDIRLASFKVLARTWLQLDDTGFLEFNPIQYVHLETRPLNCTAKNIIMRRCCLILKLAEAIEFFVVSELSTMNCNVLNSLTHCNGALAKMVRAAINKDEKCKVVSAVYYAHLDTGSDNLEGSIRKML